MKQAYEQKTFRANTLSLIEQTVSIIDEYQADGFALTLRQLYYQSVARGLIENNQRNESGRGGMKRWQPRWKTPHDTRNFFPRYSTMAQHLFFEDLTMADANHPAYRLSALPDTPDTLSEGGRRQFEILVPIIFKLRTARRADLPIIELMCEILSDCDRLENVIRTEGFTVTSSGGPKPHPALRSLDAVRRQAINLMDRFGLTPDSKAQQARRWQSERWHKGFFGE